MEYKRFVCPNCGASIDYDSKQMEVACEYCGGRFPTGVINQPNVEQSGYEFEKGRQRAMMEQRPIYNVPPQQPIKKNNYLWLWILGWTCFFPVPLTVLIWKSQKLDNKWKTGLTIALWGFLLVWGKIGGSDSTNRINSTSSNIKLNISAYELKGKNYNDVKTKFETSGFSNIVMEPVDTNEDSLVGKVIEVSVNGDTDFYSHHSYPQDAKIVIRYYANETTTEETSEKIGQEQSKKIEKNGYDEKTNNSYVIFGYKYNIPDYFGGMANNSKELSRYFYAERGSATAMINISCEDMECTQDEFDGAKDRIMNNLIEKIDDVEITESTDVTVAGHSGRNFVFTGKIDDIEMTGCFYFFHSQKNNKLIFIGLAQTNNCEYDYMVDFNKIAKNVEDTEEPDDEISVKNEVERYTEETIESIAETKTEVTTESTTEIVTEAQNESIYEYAYSREYSDYTICYLIDTDSKECIMFTTSDGYGYYGQYTGDLSSKIIVNYPREGYSDTITFQNGLGSNADVRVGDDTMTFEIKCVPVEGIEKYLKSINKD